MSSQPWTSAPLVALDLEGSGSHERDHQAIVEVAFIPLTQGRPNVQHAYETIVNPGRPIARRPWSSPGLTNDVLACGAPLEAVRPHLAAHLDGKWIVGHNVGTDGRLLALRCPELRPAGLIDTLRLARAVHARTRQLTLTALLAHYGLADEVTALVPGRQPHRALWDAVGAALLLGALIRDLPDAGRLTVTGLWHLAGMPYGDVGEQLPLPL
ncbi:3'-5' exonuclease [Planomonospora sp. ID82291]|nr:3'-5' exonuclease [Planomonospora sp. ID82291]